LNRSSSFEGIHGGGGGWGGGGVGGARKKACPLQEERRITIFPDGGSESFGRKPGQPLPGRATGGLNKTLLKRRSFKKGKGKEIDVRARRGGWLHDCKVLEPKKSEKRGNLTRGGWKRRKARWGGSQKRKGRDATLTNELSSNLRASHRMRALPKGRGEFLGRRKEEQGNLVPS